MKNNLIYLITVVLLTSVSFSQSSTSLIKNKLSLEYDINFNPLSEDNFSELTISERIKGTKKFHVLAANYKLKSRISVSLFGGIHKGNLDTKYTPYTETDFSDDLSTSGNEIGLGLNFYFRNHRAPVGNSFGVFLKRQSIKGQDFSSTNYSGDEFTINTTSIGVNLNMITMLSSKLPIYIKYGVSGALPIISDSEIPVWIGGDDEINFESAKDDYVNLNLLKVHVGLGYAF